MNFAGKTLVITGAASGIGRALAVEAAHRGAALALADVDTTGLDGTLDLVRGAGAELARFTSHNLDVSKLEHWRAFLAEVSDVHAPVDCVFNNAGITVSGTVEDTPYEKLEQVMSVNFLGMVYGSRELLPVLKTRPEGLIANVSSLYGLYGAPGQSAYCASKFAIRGFTEALGQELAGSSIAVASVHPGHIGTDIVQNARRLGNVVNAQLSDAQQNAYAEGFKAGGLSPADAAEFILDQLERGQRRIIVGPDAVRGDRWNRWFPERFARSLNASSRR